MVRWDLVAGSSLALAALLLLRSNSQRSSGKSRDREDREASDVETVETVEPAETHGTENAGDADGHGTDTDSENPEDPQEKRLPLPVLEMVLIAILVTLLVRGGALLGHTSEEQVKSGILPAEQVHYGRWILNPLKYIEGYVVIRSRV